MLNGARVYLNSWSDCGAKCCTFEGLSTEGATVEWKSKWKVLKFSNISCSAKYQGGSYYHNYLSVHRKIIALTAALCQGDKKNFFWCVPD